ncbi:MAG TPA: ATP-dependent metallopeptidase FtsH/Yme1/Tma family protein, partial [Planctomycetota bacterium]|nr:ATP-dependent metallopeptidase FtsH/Yme1/Tma family protein [Planctomycetota bacterium]
MSLLLVGLIVVLALAFSASWHRRADLRHQREVVEERAQMALRGKDAAPLQVPVIDLSTCLGCGACVRSCPEDGVLQLVHGQAAVVNAAACVGHARCVAECPVGAVSLTQGDLSARTDVPALDGELQAVGTEGLFLIGEITARSLIRTATVQGTQVAATIAARLRALPRASRAPDLVDVAIVGAGPGGLACALACKQHGLVFDLIDQEPVIGGTVAKYPRRKLVVTDAVELPLHGRLEEREFEKEELIDLWQRLARVHKLPFRGGVTFHFVERRPDGAFAVHTDAGIVRARYVVLAVGRRGTPRRLGVPGENLPHVAYGLLDAAAYTGQHVVVVGGGDSAIETALVLAEQPDNQVTIVYRKDALFRIRRKNRERLEAQLADGRIEVMFGTEITSIARGHVEVSQHGKRRVALQLRADHVFVMAGGMAPFAQLEQSGVSFDPAKRLPEGAPAAAAAPGGGLLPALAIGLALATVALCFVLWHYDYYTKPMAARAADPKHALLRSDRSLGLWFGLLATGAIGANLAYLLRRHQRWGFRFGQLSTWMTSHVGTGVVAVLFAMLHAAMAPRETPGGYAFWALLLLLALVAYRMWAGNLLTTQRIDIPYTRFVQEVEKGNIDRATFVEETRTVLGELRQEGTETVAGRQVTVKAFKTNFLGDGALLAEKTRATNPNAQLTVQAPGINWLSVLFTWLPLLLFLVAWMFMLRQMQSGGSAAMR